MSSWEKNTAASGESRASAVLPRRRAGRPPAGFSLSFSTLTPPLLPPHGALFRMGLFYPLPFSLSTGPFRRCNSFPLPESISFLAFRVVKSTYLLYDIITAKRLLYQASRRNSLPPCGGTANDAIYPKGFAFVVYYVSAAAGGYQEKKDLMHLWPFALELISAPPP